MISAPISSKSSALLACAAVAVSACSSQPAPTGPQGSYQTLTERAATPITISVLGGAIVSLNSTSGLRSVRALTGTLNHATGATKIIDVSFTLTDNNGPSASGLLSNGSVSYTSNPQYVSTDASGLPVAADLFNTSVYDYVRPIYGSHPDGAVGNDNFNGAYGVVTLAVDVPTSGSASYVGQAGGEARVAGTGAAGVSLVGASAVDANFQNNTVNLKTNSLAMRVLTTGSPLLLQPFDEVRVSGMTISGNQFSGGSIRLYNGGTLVPNADLGLLDSKAFAAGAFFGYDPVVGGPDEVGGKLRIDGAPFSANPYVDLTFIAD